MSDTTVLVLDAGCDAGRRIARAFLTDGFRVVVSGCRAEDLVGILHGHGNRALAIAADIHDVEQARRLVDRAEQRFGPIDSVVCADCASDVACLKCRRVARAIAGRRDRRVLA